MRHCTELLAKTITNKNVKQVTHLIFCETIYDKCGNHIEIGRDSRI